MENSIVRRCRARWKNPAQDAGGLMDLDAPSSHRVVAVAIVCEAALGVLAIALGWFLERPPLAQIEWSAAAVGLGLAAAAPLAIGLFASVWLPIGPLARLEELARELIAPLFASATIAELLLVCVAAGWGEELLFRGFMQTGIAQLIGRPLVALLIASILFGAAHPITLLYAILAGVIGAYLGWLLLATDNLLVPIVTHAAYDFVALLYLRSGVRDEPQPDP
jgi:uncharacterized protein